MPDTGRPNLVVICGANASGKTRLGIEIARRHCAEIISADSRQVYRGLDIGTGKDLSEYRTGGAPVRAHLIDMVEPAEVYTLWHYQRDFYAAFRDISARGLLPVAVGGTGLYLEAILRDYQLANVPEDPQLRQALSGLGREELDARLKALDPALHERTDRTTVRRLVRAIEIAQAATRDAQPALDRPSIIPLVIAIAWPRETIRQRIRDRLDRRFAEGMLDEVRGLIERGVTHERLDQFGLEYRHISRHLRGLVGFTQMREELFTGICQLAKRQMTWFRGMERRGIAVTWVDGGEPAPALALVRHGLGTSPSAQMQRDPA